MPTTDPTPYDDSRNRRTAAFIGGGLTALVAVVVLLAGGAALLADGHKDRAGYLSTPSSHVGARSYAVISDPTKVDLHDGGVEAVDDSLGTVRVQARSVDGHRVFVGIAPARDVARYLRGVAHSSVGDVEWRTPVYRSHGGARRPSVPGHHSFWAASAQGSGRQGVTWHVRNGRWSVVVMNADGSPGVHTKVRVGATLPALPYVAWTVFGLGVLFAFGAALLLAYAAQTGPRDPRPGAPAMTVSPA